jgi:hypothetical protein
LITIYKNKNIFLFLWPILVKTIIYIKNRIYNPIINKIPYETLLNKKLFISYFKILNFLNYILIFKKIRSNNKIVKKVNRKIFINYIS